MAKIVDIKQHIEKCIGVKANETYVVRAYDALSYRVVIRDKVFNDKFPRLSSSQENGTLEKIRKHFKAAFVHWYPIGMMSAGRPHTRLYKGQPTLEIIL